MATAARTRAPVSIPAHFTGRAARTGSGISTVTRACQKKKRYAYDPRIPVGTGDFFVPSSVALLVCSFGLFISGWRTPVRYRVRLFLPPSMLFFILVATAVWFWPANRALSHVAHGAADAIVNPDELTALVRAWVRYDRMRIVARMCAFIAGVRSISVPFPCKPVKDPYRSAESLGSSDPPGLPTRAPRNF